MRGFVILVALAELIGSTNGFRSSRAYHHPTREVEVDILGPRSQRRLVPIVRSETFRWFLHDRLRSLCKRLRSAVAPGTNRGLRTRAAKHVPVSWSSRKASYPQLRINSKRSTREAVSSWLFLREPRIRLGHLAARIQSSGSEFRVNFAEELASGAKSSRKAGRAFSTPGAHFRFRAGLEANEGWRQSHGVRDIR